VGITLTLIVKELGLKCFGRVLYRHNLLVHRSVNTAISLCLQVDHNGYLFTAHGADVI